MRRNVAKNSTEVSIKVLGESFDSVIAGKLLDSPESFFRYIRK